MASSLVRLSTTPTPADRFPPFWTVPFTAEAPLLPISREQRLPAAAVERCHSKMKRYRNLVSYYTNKNISVSYLRAKKKNDLDRIMGLYGNMNERYW